MNIENIKKLRREIDIGVMDVKRALIKSEGDYDKALIALKEEGILTAKKITAKITKFSTIGYYIHTNRRIAVLIELCCESEIASATEVFINLANDIAMHIAAMDSRYISRSSVPKDRIEQLCSEYKRQAITEGKPNSVISKIVDGKLEKYFKINCLLEQNYYREKDKSVQDILAKYIYILKENIEVKRFVRYEAGRII